MTSRLLSAVLVALALSAAIAVVAPQWSEICRFMTDENPLRYVFGCNIDPPPKDPSA